MQPREHANFFKRSVFPAFSHHTVIQEYLQPILFQQFGNKTELCHIVLPLASVLLRATRSIQLLTCDATTHKKNADSLHKSTTGSTSTCVFFLHDIPLFCHNSSHTSEPKTHHPATDSLVVSLQYGKATAVFVPSKDCDMVAEVSECGSRGLDLILPVLQLK